MIRNIKCPKCRQQMYYHESRSKISEFFEDMNESLLPDLVCWICFECSLVIEDENYKYDDIEKRAR